MFYSSTWNNNKTTTSLNHRHPIITDNHTGTENTRHTIIFRQFWKNPTTFGLTMARQQRSNSRWRYFRTCRRRRPCCSRACTSTLSSVASCRRRTLSAGSRCDGIVQSESSPGCLRRRYGCPSCGCQRWSLECAGWMRDREMLCMWHVYPTYCTVH